MLLQSKKELLICADLTPEDVFFYYTTTSVQPLFCLACLTNDAIIRGWMMWNFLVSGLSVGCTLVLYDGSPLRDPAFLWHLTDELNITIYGTSAKYIDQLSVSIFAYFVCKLLFDTCPNILEIIQTSRASQAFVSPPYLLDWFPTGAFSL